MKRLTSEFKFIIPEVRRVQLYDSVNKKITSIQHNLDGLNVSGGIGDGQVRVSSN